MAIVGPAVLFVIAARLAVPGVEVALRPMPAALANLVDLDWPRWIHNLADLLQILTILAAILAWGSTRRRRLPSAPLRLQAVAADSNDPRRSTVEERGISNEACADPSNSSGHRAPACGMRPVWRSAGVGHAENHPDPEHRDSECHAPDNAWPGSS
jgi:hypothetical protein